MAADMAAEVWGGHNGETAVFLHGSFTPDPTATWEKQRPLASRYRLVIASRFGYGRSPAAESGTDSLESDLEGTVKLLGTGAHLVGFSYGGFVAAMVAGRVPQLVRSLTLIEPPLYSLIQGNEAAEKLIAGLEQVYARRKEMLPGDFLIAFMGVLGYQVADVPAEEQQSAAAARREAVPWQYPLRLDALGTAPFPKLVISGGWDPANEAICDALAQQIGAQRMVISGAKHRVQGTGEPFNQAVGNMWASASPVL